MAALSSPSPRTFIPKQQTRLSSLVVDEDDVRSIRASQIAELSTLLAVSTARAETLLRAAGWRLDEAALRATDEDADEASLCAKDGAVDEALGADGGPRKSRAVVAWRPAGMKATCAVCFDDACDAYATDCGAAVCSGCWRGYLRVIVESGATVIVCPMPACRTVVSMELVTAVLGAGMGTAQGEKTDEELLDLYASRRVSDYVAGSSDLRACPGRGCESIVKRLDECEASVECGTCAARFCWKCNFEDHWPLDCKHAADWILRATSETKSQWWILKNTKLCPGCGCPVSKQGGCEHMKCARCGIDWDWGKEICYAGSVAQGGDEMARKAAQARRAEMIVVTVASEKHLKVYRRLDEARGAEMMRSSCQSFGMDMVQVEGAIGQILAAHRELRWVHMTRYFREMMAVDRCVLEANIEDLEAAVEKLESALRCDFVMPTACTAPVAYAGQVDFLERLRIDISETSAKVAMFRRVIEKLCREFI